MTADPEFSIAYMPLHELRPAKRNVKGHDQAGIDQSMQRFGFASTPMIDERTGLLEAGHGRIKTLLDKHWIGGDPPAGIRVREDGEWLVPVQRGWASENDAEAEAYGLADNRLTEVGGWDDTLAEMLESMTETPKGLDGTGFTYDDLERLLPKPSDDDTSPQLNEMLFQVVVECTDELDQREVIEQLEKEGRTVRALSM